MNGHIDVPTGSWIARMNRGKMGREVDDELIFANHLLDPIASRMFTCLTFCMKDIHD